MKPFSLAALAFLFFSGPLPAARAADVDDLRFQFQQISQEIQQFKREKDLNDRRVSRLGQEKGDQVAELIRIKSKSEEIDASIREQTQELERLRQEIARKCPQCSEVKRKGLMEIPQQTGGMKPPGGGRLMRAN